MFARGLCNSLKFAEAPVLEEQLRLLLKGVVSSTLPVVLLSFMLTVSLSLDSEGVALLVWFAIIVVIKTSAFLIARRHLDISIPPGQATRLAWIMLGFYVASGLVWGALPWLTLDSASPTGHVVVLALMAGIVGAAMALTSSVLVVFFAFALTTLSLLTIKLLMMAEPLYTMYAGASLLYFVSLLALARNSSNASASAIALLLENTALLTQLKAKTETAELSRLEAEHANLAKSKFLAAAGHDLRQPVHAQGLFLNVLTHTPLSKQQRDLVDNLRQSYRASGEMLNTLLEFSRIEAGVVRPRRDVFRLQSLLQKVEAELGALADEKGIVYRTRDTLLTVRSDPALVEQILFNLVSNAIRYTDSGGLLVGVRRRGSEAVLEVWDSGIGIPPEQQQEVFREFHQLGNPERDSRKGLGLGLAVARGLADTLGHRLTLVSAPQRGTVFRLALPLEAEALPPAAPILSSGRADISGAHILLIDDDEAIRTGTLHLLEEWGGRVAAAASIDEALARVAGTTPDIIISDYRLREQRTGIEAITTIRNWLGEEIPALLISGDTAAESLHEFQASGIPFLHKPVSSSALIRAIASALGPRADAAVGH